MSIQIFFKRNFENDNKNVYNIKAFKNFPSKYIYAKYELIN